MTRILALQQLEADQAEPLFPCFSIHESLITSPPVTY